MPIDRIPGGFSTPARPPSNPAGGAVPGTSRGPEPSSREERKGLDGVAETPTSHEGEPSPPAGVDPELWSVLTTEERRFFALTGARGSVTYEPGMGSARESGSAPRGSRIDVRV